MSRVKVELFNYMITDHHLVHVVIEINQVKCNDRLPVKPKINLSKFLELLSRPNFSSIHDIDEPCAAVDVFLTLWNDVFSASLVSQKSRSNCPIKPWISEALLNMIKRKKWLLRKAKNVRNNERFQQYVTAYCHKVKSKTIAARIAYYKNKFDNCSGDPKLMWRTINDILSNNSSNVKLINSINSPNNDILTDASDIANEFSNYFGGIASNLKFSLPFNNRNSMELASDYVEQSFFPSN